MSQQSLHFHLDVFMFPSITAMSKLGGKVIAAFATFIAVLTYLAIGAAIFQAIEQEHEIEQRNEYDKQLNKLLDKVNSS